jgi:hypothetical protein
MYINTYSRGFGQFERMYKRPIIVGFVSLTVFPDVGTELVSPFRTSKLIYHRGFG